MTVGDIKNVEAEAGVIASVLLKPELTFHSEQLKPQHFANIQNVYLYYAACELAARGNDNITPADIMNILNMKKGTSHVGEDVNGIITVQSLQELFDNATLIARTDPSNYMTVVEAVLDAAFRRNTYQKLVECEHLCFNSECKDIEKQITTLLDNVILEFSTTNEIPQYKDVVDQYWSDIEERQNPETTAVFPFKFPALNDYVLIERGELVIFGAEQKQGKSMMLLNCAVDLMRQGRRVMYIDSELNSKLFTCRMISHLTGIEFRRVRAGRYSEEEHQRILEAKEWLKTRTFTHLYMPVFDEDAVYTSVKKVYHTQQIDVLIIDYFKGNGEGDAYAVYSSLGSLVDMVKNRLAGELNIAAIGAAQATSTGRLADSAKIARNASTIIMIQDKTPEEIQQDGAECGNKKLIVRFNRNGPQMNEGEYIDLKFDGDRILYDNCKQHSHIEPY